MAEKPFLEKYFGFKSGTATDAANMEALKRSSFGDAVYQLNPFRDPNAPLPSQAAPAVQGTGLRPTAPPLASAGSPTLTPAFQTPVGVQPVPANSITNYPQGPMAKFDGQVPQPQPQAFQVRLKDGGLYEAGPQPGQRKFTYPDGSADGGGTGIALGRTGPASNPTQVGTLTQGLRPIAQATAVQPAAAGVREKTPLEISMENSDRMKATPPNGGVAAGTPQLLGPESGLGWKTRLGLFKEQMDLAKQQLANQGALQVAGLRETGETGRLGMREAGDMTRAEMQAFSAADQTGAVRERTKLEGGLRSAQAREADAKALASGRLATAADTLMKAVPGTPEHEAAMKQYLILSGQGEALARDPKQDIEKLDQKDAFGNTVSQKLVRVNRDGTFTDLKPAGAVEYNPAFTASMTAEQKQALAGLPAERQDQIYQKWVASQKGGK